MLFKEALDALHEGRFMHRSGWPIEEGYLALLDGMKFVWKIMLQPNPNAGNFIFSVADFLADDWKEFEVPHEPCVIEA